MTGAGEPIGRRKEKIIEESDKFREGSACRKVVTMQKYKKIKLQYIGEETKDWRKNRKCRKYCYVKE